MNLHNWGNKKIINESASQYMQDMHEVDDDLVQEARGKKIADPLRAKLMGMEDIRDLKGTMTPRYFATKIIRFLQSQNPELDLDKLSDADIQNAINVTANVSKPLATRPDVKITTRERGAAKQNLKKGDSGFETLQLNLGGDTVFKSEGNVGNNDLYTVVSDGLKYRVTLNNFMGQRINLDDITQDDLVSVVIVKPSESEAVDKFAGEIDLGQREKLVADFPEGEEEGEDDMDTIIKKIMGMRVDPTNPDVRHDPREVDPDMPLDVDDRFDPDMEIGPEDGEDFDDEKSDLNDDGEISGYERARGEAIAKAMKKEQERAGQSHARAVADHYEDEDTAAEDNILPIIGTGLAIGAAGAVGGKLAKMVLPKDEIIVKKEDDEDDNDQYEPDEAPEDDQMGGMEPLDDEDEERCPVTGKLRKKKSESEEEEEQEIAMSPQAIQQAMVLRGRNEMHRQHQIERMFRHGY